MNFYTVVLRMEALGQQLINRWNYAVQGTTPASTAVELLTLMGFLPTTPPPSSADETVFGGLIALQSEQLQNLEIECAELYSPTDFYTAVYSPGIPGSQATGIFSITDAYGLRTNRVRSDIKRGFKRFGGVPSAAYGGNSELDSSYQTVLGTLAERMSLPLEGATVTYDPSVFQFEEYTTPAGNKAYRKYADPDVQADHVALDVEWGIYDTIRTQVSRQFGRGI